MRGFTAATIAAIIALSAIPAMAADKPNAQLVQKIDQATASFRGGNLTISAKGAVSTGGWENPHLKQMPHKLDATTLVVEFLANPPAKNIRVVQALLPVSAVTTTKASPGMTKVQVVSRTNNMTVKIRR